MSRRYITDDELFAEELGFDERRMVFRWEEEDCPVADAPESAARAGNDPEAPEYVPVTWTFPAAYEVCHDCEGKGRVLHPDIREHAYTPEEFHESFDDEQAEEYFKGGDGIYGVSCPTCREKRVVPRVREPYGELEKRAYARYRGEREARYREEREYRAMCEMERRYGC